VIGLVLFALLLLGLGLFQVISIWLARLSARCGPTPQASMPVGPFFVSVTTIFGLVLAFHGNDLWNRFESEVYAQKRLYFAVNALERFVGPDRIARAPALIDAVSRYAELVRQEVRPAPGLYKVTAEMDAALFALEVTVAHSAEGLPAAVHSSLARVLSEVANAHSALHLREETARPNVLIWIGMLGLTLLSNVSIALVHQDRTAAGTRALLLFNLAVGICFWLMLRYEFRVPLAAALAALRSG
jgi:hypothetical protein